MEISRRRSMRVPVHVNRPNFRWALTAEDMIGLQGFRFFEVYVRAKVISSRKNDKSHVPDE